MRKNQIEKNISKGLGFLLQNQLNDGNFPSITSSDLSDKVKKRYQSIFSATLILDCLNELPESKGAGVLKSKLSKFLLSQKSEYWTFNYWDRGSEDFKKLPYPDDLDDTFCALSALHRMNSGIVDGSVLAKAVSVLTVVEIEEGGPYHTWIAGNDEKWKDIDLAVNSNVAYFLSLEDISLDSIDKLIKNAINTSDYSSQYYSSEYSVIYFISRFYKHKDKNKIIRFLVSKRKKNGSWGNVLDTALACISLLNFGYNPQKLKESLSLIQSSQNKDGSWDRYSFVVEKINRNKKHYSGSVGLTTAFCLCVFQKYLDSTSKLKKKKEKNDSGADKIRKEVEMSLKIKVQETKIFSCDDFLKEKKLLLGGINDDQIILLPYYFKKALGNQAEGISDKDVINLGLAGLYGWIAYAIYDDFLDNVGDKKKLLIANIFSRELTSIFIQTNSRNKEFVSFFSDTMDKIERANKWELENCHLKSKRGKVEIDSSLSFGRLSMLSEKSIGHSLGVVSILFLLGYSKDSDEIKNIMKFFHHFIVARQINDDMHDWEDDLKNGQINSVFVWIFDKWKKERRLSGDIAVDVNSDVPIFREFFWNNAVDDICSKVIYHTGKATHFLNQIDLKGDKTFLEEMIFSVENVAKKTIKEQKEALKFIDSYKKS
ncbi:hypothetical protein ACFL08_00790 [Patescibacteria group bacterium]